jgi:hypothetical protein
MMTLSITTFSIVTLSIRGLFVTLSIKGLFVTLSIKDSVVTLSINDTQHNSKSIIRLNVIRLSVLAPMLKLGRQKYQRA